MRLPLEDVTVIDLSQHPRGKELFFDLVTTWNQLGCVAANVTRL